MSQPFWRTSLSAVEPNKILIRGYRVQDLMGRCSFGDVIYLTFKGELPAGNEGRLIEMIVVSSTDHSFLAPSIDATRFVASGGVPLQAAVAAGILSLGDHYGRAFFIIPRVVGLAAHAVEETTRERPFRAIDLNDIAYDGPPERDLP